VETTTTVNNTIEGHKIADYTNEEGETVDINETTTTLEPSSSDDLNYTYTNEEGTETTFRSSPIVAFGKVSRDGTLLRGYGATVTRVSTGLYEVTLNTARSTADYIIQLSILDSSVEYEEQGVDTNDDFDVTYREQTETGFRVQIGDNDNGGSNRRARDLEFMFTVIDY